MILCHMPAKQDRSAQRKKLTGPTGDRMMVRDVKGECRKPERADSAGWVRAERGVRLGAPIYRHGHSPPPSLKAMAAIDHIPQPLPKFLGHELRTVVGPNVLWNSSP